MSRPEPLSSPAPRPSRPLASRLAIASFACTGLGVAWLLAYVTVPEESAPWLDIPAMLILPPLGAAIGISALVIARVKRQPGARPAAVAVLLAVAVMAFLWWWVGHLIINGPTNLDGVI